MVGLGYNRKYSNMLYLETYTSYSEYRRTNEMNLPLESFIVYIISQLCPSPVVTVRFVHLDKAPPENEVLYNVFDDSLRFMYDDEVPWQLKTCVLPFVMKTDVVITGLCAVARHICLFRNGPPLLNEHEEGLLGFRHSCLQAPNEVSIWTKFCEVDIINTVKDVLTNLDMKEVPVNLVRFENHLKKPVRVHNIYKIARDIKKNNAEAAGTSQSTEELDKPSDGEKSPKDEEKEEKGESSRVQKSRKWKSNKKKSLEIDSSTKLEELDVCHQFAEGPFLTLADLILLPSYHIIVQVFGESVFELHLPFTMKWYKNMMAIPRMKMFTTVLKYMTYKSLSTTDIALPDTEDVSLYKCDPKRSNPKKRLFTKEDDIRKALASITDDKILTVSANELKPSFKWDNIPPGANAFAGHLPDKRTERKAQQLENLAMAALSLAKDGDVIVDFCCGSGHLGVLLAYLLPDCTIIMLDNKEQSLFRARERILSMHMKNIFFYQCNLDFFIGKFDLGIGLHACGVATDLVLDKCLKVNAKFILCPCCYGAIHPTDAIVYPRSTIFRDLPIDQYLCICHTAGQTHKSHPLTPRGVKCMEIIDSDRAHLAEEKGYKVTMLKLEPETCTPKNNLIIGIPS